MASTNNTAVDAQVIEVMPANLYRLKLEDGTEIMAHMGGKMRLNRIFIVMGDYVKVILDPYKGKTTNRIIYRSPLKKNI